MVGFLGAPQVNMTISFRTVAVIAATLLVCIAGAGVLRAAAHAQAAQRQAAAPPAVPSAASPASTVPTKTVTAQTYPKEQIDAGQGVFLQNCAFCHGRDAGGGETGPDLTRSELVAQDVRGDKIAPVVHGGRIDKGMPSFNLSDQDFAAVVAFIHDQKTKADSAEGGRQHVTPEDLQTGSADGGKAFFNGDGKCATCHSPTGDLAGIGARLQGLTLLQRMLYPGGRGGPRGTVTVTLPSGQTINGDLAYRDEFTIALRDANGKYRSWPTNQVKYAVNVPVDVHVELLSKYTDDEMHNILAYLQTLK